MLIATTSTLCIATTKVAAVGRHHTRGGAASGRAAFFVVSFAVAMHRVDVEALNIIFVLFVHYSFIVGALSVHYSLFRSLSIN